MLKFTLLWPSHIYIGYISLFSLLWSIYYNLHAYCPLNTCIGFFHSFVIIKNDVINIFALISWAYTPKFLGYIFRSRVPELKKMSIFNFNSYSQIALKKKIDVFLWLERCNRFYFSTFFQHLVISDSFILFVWNISVVLICISHIGSEFKHHFHIRFIGHRQFLLYEVDWYLNFKVIYCTIQGEHILFIFLRVSLRVKHQGRFCVFYT